MHILPYTLEYQYINKCSDVNTSVNGQNVAGRKQIQICFLELSGFFFFFFGHAVGRICECRTCECLSASVNVEIQ